MFLVTAAVYAVGALLYGLLASGEKQVNDTSCLDCLVVYDTTCFEFGHVS